MKHARGQQDSRPLLYLEAMSIFNSQEVQDQVARSVDKIFRKIVLHLACSV